MSENGRKQCFRFYDFELDTQRRVITRGGVAVPLKPKAVDLLIALVESRGRPVSKNDLLERVWDDRFVEEKNLSVHIAALRKAFGEGKGENRFIATVPGTGYAFVADVVNEYEGEQERRTEAFRRIVIEEEFEVTPLSSIAVAAGPDPNGYRSPGNFRLKVATVSMLVILIGLAGWGVWKSQFPSVASVAASDNGGPKIRRLTTNGDVSEAAISPDGKLFAYVTSVDGKRALWSGFVAGGKETMLMASDDIWFASLAFTADSSFVLVGINQSDPARNGIFKIPASGGPAQEVISGVIDFTPSKNGSSSVFISRPSTRGEADLLIEHDLTTGSEASVTEIPRSIRSKPASISVSPDKTRIAASIPSEKRPLFQEVAIIEASTGSYTRVGSTLIRGVERTVWSSDGRHLFVTAIPADSWSSLITHQIYRIDTTTLKVTPLTNDISSYQRMLSVSQDGSAIVSVEHRQLNNIAVAAANDVSAYKMITNGSFGRYDGLWGMDFTPDEQIVFTNSDKDSQVISIMNADGTNVRQLTPPGRVDSACSVTADGRYIVFLSDRSGVVEIWRMNIDGSGAVPLTRVGAAFQPFISADGSWVYFRNGSEEGRGRIYRVPVNGGEAVPVTNVDSNWGSSSPDGKYIAFGSAAKLVVIDAATFAEVRSFEMPKNSTVAIGTRWTPDSKAVVYRDWVDGYRMQDIAGGEPRRMSGLPQEKLYNFAFSKNGKSFAFVRGQETSDAVLMLLPH